MTQIAQGAHAYIFPEPGQVYRVQADDVATVQIIYGAPSALITLTAQSQTFGPYDSPAKLKVSANTAACEYTLIRAHYAELTQQQLAGGAVGVLASNNAGGAIEPDGDVPSLGGPGSSVTIVNDLTTGGTTAALSAEMGKTLQTNKLGANADAIADVLEAAATGAPADLARIQSSVSGAALRSRKIILFGDSRTNDSEFTDALNRMSTNFSWFDYGNFVAGSVLDPVNKGIGGNTTAQMRARFQADVLAEKPAYMTIMAGTNNSLLTIAAADSAYADMEYMITTAVASGIRTFCVSETTGSAPLRAAPYPAIVQYYNDRLRNLCNSLRGADFWDFNSLIIDPANASGLAKTGANRDGLHFSALSASRIGRDVVAPALKGLGLSSLAQLINGLQDTLGNNTYVTQILSNPLYATATGGTIIGASNSGVLPSGVTGSGSPTTVFSVPARADGIGNNIRASSTATASSTVFISQSITASRVVGGGVYVIEGSLDIQNTVSVFRVPVGLQFSDGTSTYKYSWGQAAMSAVAGDGLVPMSGVFRSRPFTIPSVTVTSASLEMAIAFSAAGSATVDFGRMSIRRVG